MTWWPLFAIAVLYVVGCARPPMKEQDDQGAGEQVRITQAELCCGAAGESFSETHQKRAAVEQVLLWLTLLQALSPAVDPVPPGDGQQRTAAPRSSASTPAREVALPMHSARRIARKTLPSSAARVEAR